MRNPFGINVFAQILKYLLELFLGKNFLQASINPVTHVRETFHLTEFA